MASELYIRIIAEDSASAKFRQVGESAGDMADNMESAGAAATMAGGQIDSAGNEASEAGTEFSTAAQNIGQTEQALDKAGDQADVTGEQIEKAGEKTKQTGSIMDSSAVKMTTALTAVATSAMALYSAYDNVGDKALALEKAQLSARKASDAVTDAQEAYNEALEKYGSDSEEAVAAANDLSIAQETYELKAASAENAQENLNTAQLQMALTVAPAVITGVKGISDAWGVLQKLNVSKTIDGISTALGTHKLALGGAFAAGAAFFFAYEAFASDSPTIKAAFSLLTGAATTLAIAQWAVASGAIAAQEILTLGGATWLVALALASAGAVYAASSLYGAAEGAVVKGGSGGTPVLVGEGSRDELIIPLPRNYEIGDMTGGTKTVNVTNNFYITKTDDADALVAKVVKATRRAAGVSI